MYQRSRTTGSVIIAAALIAMAAVFAYLSNLIASVLQTGLEKSASIRVAKAESCSASEDTHFTGCSSIL